MKYLSFSTLIIFLIILLTSCSKSNSITECEVECENYKILGGWITDSIIEYSTQSNYNSNPPQFTHFGDDTIYRLDTFNIFVEDRCICSDSIIVYYSYYNDTLNWNLGNWNNDSIPVVFGYENNGILIYSDGSDKMFISQTLTQGSSGSIFKHNKLYFLRKL